MCLKALRLVAEFRLRAVSCPGVHLPAKDDIYLSVSFMGQYTQSDCVPATFPLLFHEKMTFEKIFRDAVDPGDIAVMLEYETVRLELVQLIPPVGDTLACFEEDARSFLFPEPKLVPSFSGVSREVLMTRAPHFPGIAPRLEFSTKTTIMECSLDAEINIYPNVPLQPNTKRSSRLSSSPRNASPQRRRPQTLFGQRVGRVDRERHGSARPLSFTPRSQSPSPLRTGNTQHPELLDRDSTSPRPHYDTSQTMLTTWPGAGQTSVPTSSASPLTRSSSTVRYSPTPQRNSSLVGELCDDDSSSSLGCESPVSSHGPDPSALWQSNREHGRRSRSYSTSHQEWEEVHERVRGLLTTPKAIRRLVYGVTASEVDKVLARRSISSGPP